MRHPYYDRRACLFYTDFAEYDLSTVFYFYLLISEEQTDRFLSVRLSSKT